MTYLLDILCDYLSNTDFTYDENFDYDRFLDTLQESGIDLSQYSISEIREALESALDNVDINDSNIYTDSKQSSRSSEISFEGATYIQDEAYKEFKDYLWYHCTIPSYDIPKNDLITVSGDYSHSAISDLKAWVRKLYANNRISGYDRDCLLGYLNRMK